MAGKYVGFIYDLTPGEFAFLLFGKKICPACGEKLRLVKGFEEADSSRYKRGKVKRYRYTYSCPACGGEYALAELAEKKG